MGEAKPTLYLDKGALSLLDLQRVSELFQICYSEATLLDMLNDKSGARDLELDTLNEVCALYLYREADQVLSTQADAHEQMRKVDPVELDIMVNSYRFMNGGGNLSLFDTVFHQVHSLLNRDDGIQDLAQLSLHCLASDQTLEPREEQMSGSWRVELQKATKSWSQAQEATLRSVLNQSPELARTLKEYFPGKPKSILQIQLAAMLLGILQMGSDRGILSPSDVKSEKAARNGYVDFLHILFGLHCHAFLTTDKATLRRFQLLNDFWQLERTSALVARRSLD